MWTALNSELGIAPYAKIAFLSLAVRRIAICCRIRHAKGPPNLIYSNSIWKISKAKTLSPNAYTHNSFWRNKFQTALSLCRDIELYSRYCRYWNGRWHIDGGQIHKSVRWSSDIVLWISLHNVYRRARVTVCIVMILALNHASIILKLRVMRLVWFFVVFAFCQRINHRKIKAT